MDKVRFLINYGIFDENTYRPIVEETDTAYRVLVNMQGNVEESVVTTKDLPKGLAGNVYEVISNVK